MGKKSSNPPPPSRPPRREDLREGVNPSSPLVRPTPPPPPPPPPSPSRQAKHRIHHGIKRDGRK